jgi:hypothetical protein
MQWVAGRMIDLAQQSSLTIAVSPCYTPANNQPTTLTGKSNYAHGVQRVGGWCEADTYAHGEWTHESRSEH